MWGVRRAYFLENNTECKICSSSVQCAYGQYWSPCTSTKDLSCADCPNAPYLQQQVPNAMYDMPLRSPSNCFNKLKCQPGYMFDEFQDCLSCSTQTNCPLGQYFPCNGSWTDPCLPCPTPPKGAYFTTPGSCDFSCPPNQRSETGSDCRCRPGYYSPTPTRCNESYRKVFDYADLDAMPCQIGTIVALNSLRLVSKQSLTISFADAPSTEPIVMSIVQNEKLEQFVLIYYNGSLTANNNQSVTVGKSFVYTEATRTLTTSGSLTLDASSFLNLSYAPAQPNHQTCLPCSPLDCPNPCPNASSFLNADTEQCVPCDAYSAWWNGTLCECKAQTPMRLNWTHCVCPPGFYCSSGEQAPAPCPKGSYYCPTNSTSPLLCANGSYTNASAQSECVPCLPGSAGQGCEACKPGTFSQQQLQCSTCAAGSYAPNASATACQACPPGTIANESGATRCDPCSPGWYASSSTRQCAQCTAGSYASAAGSTACDACIPGSFSSSSTACAPCAAGTFADDFGLSECLLCRSGSYSAQNSTACTLCTLGRAFADTQGAQQCRPCTQCGAGTYASVNCTTTTDTKCSECATGCEFTLQACTALSDTVCRSCTTCQQPLLQLWPCSNSTDTTCVATCPLGRYTNNNLTCSVCPPVEPNISYSYLREGSCNVQCNNDSFYAKADACVRCTSGLVCGAGQYIVPCNATADATCATCPAPSDHNSIYNSTGCGIGSQVCKPGFARQSSHETCTNCSTYCELGKYPNMCQAAYNRENIQYCIPCNIIPVGAEYTTRGSCEWACAYGKALGDDGVCRCKRGYYRTTQAPCEDMVHTLSDYGTPSIIQSTCTSGKIVIEPAAATEPFITQYTFTQNVSINITAEAPSTRQADAAITMSDIFLGEVSKFTTDDTKAPLFCLEISNLPNYANGYPLLWICWDGLQFEFFDQSAASLGYMTAYKVQTSGYLQYSYFSIQLKAPSQLLIDFVPPTLNFQQFFTLAVYTNYGTRLNLRFEHPDTMNCALCSELECAGLCPAGSVFDVELQQCLACDPETTTTSSCACLPAYSYRSNSTHCHCPPNRVCPSGTCRSGFFGPNCAQCSACINGTSQLTQCTTEADTTCTECGPNSFRDKETACAPCATCATGKYQARACTRTEDTLCAYCAQGFFATPTACNACGLCRAGEYRANACAAAADTLCLSCPAGSFAAAANQTACAACAAGKYSSQLVVGATACSSCTTCQPGQYQSAACSPAADSVCLSCPAGSFAAAANQTACASCAVGQYSNGTACANCSACAPGTRTKTRCSPSKDTECKACYPPYYAPDGNVTACLTCSTCPPGNYVQARCQPTADTRCQPCPDKTYSQVADAGACASCSVCPAGKYTDRACTPQQDASCTQCPLGTYSPVAAATACLSCSQWCQAGTYQYAACSATTDTLCRQCQSNQYQPSANRNASCLACATSCPAGSSVATACNATADVRCTSCEPGKFARLPNATACATCSTCPPGGFQRTQCNATADTTCEPCAAGQYKAIAGAAPCAACSSCSAGTYLTQQCTPTSDTQCAPCKAGYNYSLTTNQPKCTECTPCAAGQYPLSACTPSSNYLCAACPSGQYSQAGNACSNCSQCQPGTGITANCTATADTTCAPCAAGKYSSEQRCLGCEPGTYSQAERPATACTQCAPGYVSQAESTACQQCPTSTYDTRNNNTCAPCAGGGLLSAPAGSYTPCSASYPMWGALATRNNVYTFTPELRSINFVDIQIDSALRINDIHIAPDGSYILLCVSSTIQKHVLGQSDAFLLAGTPGRTGTTDGPALAALFGVTLALCIHPSGAFAVISDTWNNRMRKLDMTTMTVTTFPHYIWRPMKPSITPDAQYFLVISRSDNDIAEVMRVQLVHPFDTTYLSRNAIIYIQSNQYYRAQLAFATDGRSFLMSGVENSIINYTYPEMQRQNNIGQQQQIITMAQYFAGEVIHDNTHYPTKLMTAAGVDWLDMLVYEITALAVWGCGLPAYAPSADGTTCDLS